jgi:hypothetical protein
MPTNLPQTLKKCIDMVARDSPTYSPYASAGELEEGNDDACVANADFELGKNSKLV